MFYEINFDAFIELQLFLKIEALEVKIQKEMVELKEKLGRMEKEMVEFSDLDGLRTRAEEKRRNLADEKEQLDERKGAVTQNLHEIESTVKSLKVSATFANIC